MGEDGQELELEARVFGRYLVGRVPPPDIVARYVEAGRTLFAAPAPASERAVVAFARRHPWSVGLLDGAAGLLRPGGLLRGKLIVMGAILEASPGFADDFLPRNVRGLSFLLALAGLGTLAVLRAIAGLPLHAVVARQRA
jgi:hypothetical protein